MNLVERYKKPTPKFFKILRNIGATLATVGGTLLTAPVALPAIFSTWAAYALVAGSVATVISQAAVDDLDYTHDQRQRPLNGIKRTNHEH